MNKFIKIYLFFLLLSFTAFAQKNNKGEEKLLYRSDFAYGVIFNTNGGLLGGVMFKYARAISARKFHSFYLEAVNIKNPKEQRISSLISGNQYIYGKQNYLYNIRMMYGREFLLFKKAPESGVQVNLVTTGGLALGLLTPYLIEYQKSQNAPRIIEQYDYKKHDIRGIWGAGTPLEGLSQAKFKTGTSLRAAVNFEFGAFRNSTTGFEIGVVADAYPEKLVLMQQAPNKSVYTAVFATFFYGIKSN